MTMREKQILARAIGIQKKTRGNHAFLRDNFKSVNISKKRQNDYKATYGIFPNLKLNYL